MSEIKINLEEIWSKYEEFSKAPNLPGAIDLKYFKPTVNTMMIEFGKQLLGLAAENAECRLKNKIECTNLQLENGFVIGSNAIIINKQSILDTIKQVE